MTRTPIAPALAFAFALAALGAGTSAHAQQAAPAPLPCKDGDIYKYLCGGRAPEDLVQVPGTNWIIASGLADAAKPGSGGLWVVNGAKPSIARAKIELKSARKPFDNCPGPLDVGKLSAHGLSIRAAGRGRATLYVVGHAGREAIEVFDVSTSAAGPTLTWAGCIPTPAGSFMNSVTALADGLVISTEFYKAPYTMADQQRGTNTGGVHVWKPGAAGWTKLPGTDLPGANGVEVTPDGKWLFVAVTGTSSVMRYDLAATDKPPTALKTAFRTDNLRWGPDGRLLLAGPGPDPSCAGRTPCPPGAFVGALDPKTMDLKMVLSAPNDRAFPGISSALITGDTLWLGSYQSDRVMYLKMER